MTHPKYSQPHQLMMFFAYDHLPLHLQEISRPFCELAEQVDRSNADNNFEKEACLRKLLEAKDCAVRANLIGE